MTTPHEALAKLIDERTKLIALQAILPTTTYGILRAADLGKHISETTRLIEIAAIEKVKQ